MPQDRIPLAVPSTADFVTLCVQVVRLTTHSPSPVEVSAVGGSARPGANTSLLSRHEEHARFGIGSSASAGSVGSACLVGAAPGQRTVGVPFDHGARRSGGGRGRPGPMGGPARQSLLVFPARGRGPSVALVQESSGPTPTWLHCASLHVYGAPRPPRSATCRPARCRRFAWRHIERARLLADCGYGLEGGQWKPSPL